MKIKVYNQAEELVVEVEGRYREKDIKRIVEPYCTPEYVCYTVRRKNRKPIWSKVHGKFEKFQQITK